MTHRPPCSAPPLPGDAAPAGLPAPPPGPLPVTGLHIPLVTPFTAADAVALDALEALAHTVLDAGASGLVALGTTGEPSSLEAEEREAVVTVCARVARERAVPLTVGVEATSTRGTEHALAALAERPGVTAALVRVPPFTRPGEAGVLAHFTRLCAVSALPLIVYHVPYRTAQPLSPRALRAIGSLPGVAGVKYAPGVLDSGTVALFADPPRDCALLAGDDTLASPLLALGAHGAVLASAHLATAGFAALIRAWETFSPEARRLAPALSVHSASVFAEPNPSVVKALLHRAGLIPTPAVRLPLLPASEPAVERAARALEKVGPDGVRMRARPVTSAPTS